MGGGDEEGLTKKNTTKEVGSDGNVCMIPCWWVHNLTYLQKSIELYTTNGEFYCMQIFKRSTRIWEKIKKESSRLWQTNVMQLQMNHITTLKGDLRSFGKQCFDSILRQKDPCTNTEVRIFVYPRSIGQQFWSYFIWILELNKQVNTLQSESQVSCCQRKRLQISKGERL